MDLHKVVSLRVHGHTRIIVLQLYTTAFNMLKAPSCFKVFVHQICAVPGTSTLTPCQQLKVHQALHIHVRIERHKFGPQNSQIICTKPTLIASAWSHAHDWSYATLHANSTSHARARGFFAPCDHLSPIFLPGTSGRALFHVGYSIWTVHAALVLVTSSVDSAGLKHAVRSRISSGTANNVAPWGFGNGSYIIL